MQNFPFAFLLVFIPFCSSQFYFESYLMWLYVFLMVKSFRKEGSVTELKSSLSTVDKKHTQNLRQTHQKTTHYASLQIKKKMCSSYK